MSGLTAKTQKIVLIGALHGGGLAGALGDSGQGQGGQLSPLPKQCGRGGNTGAAGYIFLQELLRKPCVIN